MQPSFATSGLPHLSGGLCVAVCITSSETSSASLSQRSQPPTTSGPRRSRCCPLVCKSRKLTPLRKSSKWLNPRSERRRRSRVPAPVRSRDLRRAQSRGPSRGQGRELAATMAVGRRHDRALCHVLPSTGERLCYWLSLRLSLKRN